MKRYLTTVLASVIILFATAVSFTGCNTTASYKTIDGTATLVLAANAAYLQSVVSGQTPTNNVPRAEAAFNDTMMSLKLAATVSAMGAKAPTPPVVQTKARAFVTYVNSQPKVKK